jgi:hypothetical protein
MIDDEQVSCPVFPVEPASRPMTATYSIILKKQAQLVSLILKRISQTSQQSPETFANTMMELCEHLEAFKDFAKELIDVDLPLEVCKAEDMINTQQASYVRMGYYISVFDVHTILTSPWSYKLLSPRAQNALRSQVQKSTEIVAKTARNAILATQFLRLDATTSIL